MKMKLRETFKVGILILLSLACLPLAAQQSPAVPSQPAPDSAHQPALPQNLQTISQSGLLPVYGVDVAFDPSWADDTQFPSQSAGFPNFGVNSAFQQIWGALRPGGYSVLRVSLDVRDPSRASKRAANLCVWAKNNNVRLILLLGGADSGHPLDENFPKLASEFVKAIVGLMRESNGQSLTDYTQILAYQLDDELNHPGKHGGMAEADAEKLILATAKSLRNSENNALSGSGLSATPLMASASFDFDLISAGAIAGGPLTDATYDRAHQSLNHFFSGLSGSGELDLLAVDWFAGSVGGGGVEKFPELLKSLLADFPGKQFVINTGFSTAFRSAEEQKRLFTIAFANLSDFRASCGANCPFVGVLFREAVNGSNPNPVPPRATLPGDMDKWDWAAKAAELTGMWTKNRKSAEMDWWLASVENNMGLVKLQNDPSGNVAAVNALPAQQRMTQIASTVGDVNSQMGGGAASNFNPYASGFVPPAAAPATPPADPNANPYAQPSTLQTQQQPPQAGLQPQAPASPYNTVQANSFGPPQQNAANPYGGAPANAGAQPGCAPNFQPPQPSADPYAQQSYGQTAAATCTAFTAGSAAGTSQGFQGLAQQGMMGLLNGVLQRFSGGGAGVGGAAYSSGAYSSLGNNPATSANNLPGSPYDYSNSSTNSAPSAGQPATYSSSNQPSVTDAAGSPVAATQTGSSTVSPSPLNGASSGSGATGGVAATTANVTGATGSGGGLPTTTNSAETLKISNIQVGTLGQKVAPGETSSIVVSLLNPDVVPLSNIQTTLILDGQTLQTQSLLVLLPQQSRSLVFAGVKFTHSGQYQITVNVDGQRLGVAALTSSANRSFGVADVSNAVPAVPGGAGAPTVSQPANTGGAIVAGNSPAPSTTANPPVNIPQQSAPAPVRSVVPQTIQIGAAVLPVGPRALTGNAPSTVAAITRPIVTARPITALQPAVTAPTGTATGSATSAGATGTRPILPLPARPGSTGAPGSTVVTANAAVATGAQPPPKTGSLLRPGPNAAVLPPTQPTTGIPPRPGQPSPAKQPETLSPPAGVGALPAGAQVALDLSVAAPDVRFFPVSPRPGQSTTFSAVVHNLGTTATQDASVVFKLISDTGQVTASTPMTFSIEGRGAFQTSWTTVMPTGQKMQLVVSVAASGDANPANNQATLLLTLPAQSQQAKR